ncbi:general substrate transporter [Zychaea mexicana]|uniref:general substrate transporter n=1 Tax=Zychaea mexicana TaxID=64656 RepID=UPI0022FF3CC8|nr:general substrate transporter [Zychaea mexicana]KAI9490426.1 general substrate transporter [Zychaea mexicana]
MERDSREARYPVRTVLCVLISCIGSFSMGWTIGSPNLPAEATHSCANGDAHKSNPNFPDCLPMNSSMWGIVVSIFCIGALIASFLAEPAMTRLGRKATIAISNAGWIVGAIVMGLATSPVVFGFGRFCVGLSCGMGSVATPTYNGEVSTILFRGAMGVCNQLMIVCGILASNAVGIFLSNVPLWRVNYSLVAVPALLQILLVPLLVESPRYLVSINKDEEARRALQKLRGSQYNVEFELEDIIQGQRQATAVDTTTISSSTTNHEKGDVVHVATTTANAAVVKESQKSDECSFSDLLRDPHLRYVTLTIMILHMAQQFSGVNGVMYYSTIIFRQSFGADQARQLAFAGSAVNLVITLLSVFLVERCGRRFLLLLAQSVGALSAALLVISGHYNIPALTSTAVMVFISAFAIGLGPIPWLLTSELTPTRATSRVTAIATAANWLSNFGVALMFPTMLNRIQSYAFLIFAASLTLSTIFTFRYVPETKGRPIEEITNDITARVLRNRKVINETEFHHDGR